MSSVAQELADELQESMHLSVLELEQRLEDVNDEKSKLTSVLEQHRMVLITSHSLLAILYAHCPFCK